jgi:RNA polymerase sigma-70 factor (ECF subfamily)
LEIDALDPEDRALLLLFDLEGYTHEEIAALLGITPGASRVRLHRVRARLRERLAPLIQEGER